MANRLQNSTSKGSRTLARISGTLLAALSCTLLFACEGYLQILTSEEGGPQTITLASGTPSPEASGAIIQVVESSPSPPPDSSVSSSSFSFFGGFNFFGLSAPAPLPSTLVDITSDQLTPFWSESNSVVVEDFNQDGTPDFFSTQMAYEARLYLSQPDGTHRLATKTLFPLEASNWSLTKSAAVLDFDEDGRKDLLVALATGPSNAADAPTTALQPRLYLSAGERLGIAQNPAKALGGWAFAEPSDLTQLFGRKLDKSEADGNDGAIGAALTHASKMAAADLDGDGFEELFVQANEGSARVLWSPSMEGTPSLMPDGRIYFAPASDMPAFSNSSNFTYSALWKRDDLRTFMVGSRVLIWPVPAAVPGQSTPYLRAAAREASLSELYIKPSGTAGFFFRGAEFPADLIGKRIRVRQKGVWVVRKFLGTSHVRARDPVLQVSDLNGDGRFEVIVADGTLHSGSLSAKCGSSSTSVTESCKEGRLHIYGFDSVTRYFVDWMRLGSFTAADAGANDLEREVFQKGFPNPGGIAAVDIDGNGIKDLVILPKARSDSERIALTMEKYGIQNSVPGPGAIASDTELFESSESGKKDIVQEDSYFSNDRHGLSNSRPKILLLQTDADPGALSASRVSTQLQISTLIPAFLDQALDVQSAAQVRSGATEWLLVAPGSSVPSNFQTIISFPLSISGSTARAIGDPISCPRNRGDELPQNTLFPGIVVADFNRDGKFDVLNLPVGQGALHFGNGTGCFEHRNRLPLDSRFINQLQAADLNGDGSMDLVGALESDTSQDLVDPNSRALLYINDGSGHFTDFSKTLQVNGRNFAASRVLATDLNGDRKPDIILFGTNKLRSHPQLASPGVILLLNRGLSEDPEVGSRIRFEQANSCLPPYLRNWSPAPDSTAQSPSFTVSAVDFDQDRRMDILLGHRKGNPDILFNAMVRESDETVCARSDCTPGGIRAGRCARLVSARFDLGAETPQSGPIFSTSPASTGGLQRLGELSVGDYNGDGKPDITFSSPQGPTPNPALSGPFNAVFVNRIQSSFMNEFPTGDWRTWFPLSERALPVAIANREGAVCNVSADFDEDGRPDLFLAGPGECYNNRIDPLINPRCQQKTQDLLPPWADSTVWDYRAWAAVLANITPEGGEIQFSTESPTAGNSLLSTELNAFPGTQTFSCTTGDFNGDGCVDVYMAGYGFGNAESTSFGGTPESAAVQKWYAQAKMSRIYLNQCTHTRGLISFTPLEPERNPFKAYSSVSADFDGDGRPEIIQGGANQMHLFKMK